MNKETRQFTWGLIQIWLGIILCDYCINRISTDQKIWLGIIQGIFGVAVLLDGYNSVQKTIL